MNRIQHFSPALVRLTPRRPGRCNGADHGGLRLPRHDHRRGVALVWAGTADYAELAGWAIRRLLILLFVWQTRWREWDALHLVASSTPVLFVMFVAFGCALHSTCVSLAVTGEFVAKPELLGLTPSALGIFEWGFATVFMVIIQPIAEGLIFRGIALPSIRQFAGAWGGMIVTPR